MSSIKTTMTADAQDLLQKQQKVAEGAAFISNEYRKLTREAQSVESAAKRAFEQSRTPLERYNDKVRELDELLRKGKISHDTHARSIDQAKQKYEQATQAGSAWGDVLEKLVGYGAGFFSVATAINAVTQSIRAATEEAERAAQVVQEGFATRGELVQLVEGRTQEEMREDLNRLRAEAARFRTEGGVPSEALANQVIFALRSTGFMPDADLFRQIGRTGLVSSEKLPQLINSMDSLRDAMGQAEVGTVEQMLNKALIAGQVSQTDIQQNLTAAAMAGSGARALGISDEETLAAIAVLTDPLGSAEQAATRMRSLFKSLEKAGIKGPLAASLESLKGANIPDVLGGDQEAIQAFRLLDANRKVFDQLSQDMVAGQTGNALRDRLAVAMTDAQQRAGIAVQTATGAIAVGREGIGTRELLRQSVLDLEDELDREIGRGNMLGRSLGRFMRGAPVIGSLRSESEIMFSEAKQQEIRDLGNQRANALLEQILDAQRQLLEATRAENKKTEDNRKANSARQTPRPNVPRPEA